MHGSFGSTMFADHNADRKIEMNPNARGNRAWRQTRQTLQILEFHYLMTASAMGFRLSLYLYHIHRKFSSHASVNQETNMQRFQADTANARSSQCKRLSNSPMSEPLI
jgi:hypothetical protein